MSVTDLHRFLDLPEDGGEDRTSAMRAGTTVAARETVLGVA